MSAVLEPIVGRCLALTRKREGHPASVLAHPRLRRSPISRRAERCRDHRALPRDRLRHAVARKVLAAPRLRARGVSPDARLPHVVSRGDIAGLVARLAAASCSTLPPRTPSASARGLQASAHVAPYYDTEWLHHADMHGGEVCAGIVPGLVVAASFPARGA